MTDPLPSRESIATQFLANWIRRFPDYGAWHPGATTEELAAALEGDSEFPGCALGDFFGRPDSRAIRAAVTRVAPFGWAGGVAAETVALGLELAVDRSCSNRRKGLAIASVAGLVAGAAALLSRSPASEKADAGKEPEPAKQRGRVQKGANRMKRVFIAFAKEDERIRDLIKGQSLLDATPFEYVDMSVKEPYSSEWKDRVRTRIRGSDGVIALLSRASVSASGQLWEIQCAIEERKPLVGLYIYKDDRTTPAAMQGKQCIVWTWSGIATFINSL